MGESTSKQVEIQTAMAEDTKVKSISATSTQDAVGRMDSDADIISEAKSLSAALSGTTLHASSTGTPAQPLRRELVSAPLNWRPGQGGHKPNAHTRSLIAEVGGMAGVVKFTSLFYKKAFADPVLDNFIRDHKDPHGSRFAAWITEKFGVGEPWTQERATRKICPFSSHGQTLQTPHDRSSAHFAAWHSPKREPEKFGRHFKLDDCRIWMRLHFWALREAGIVETSPSFAEYYIKFIGHFVSVYEGAAPPFARESFRWSADPANTKRYLANGRQMEPGVVGVGARLALAQLPPEERGGEWPYV